MEFNVHVPQLLAAVLMLWLPRQVLRQGPRVRKERRRYNERKVERDVMDRYFPVRAEVVRYRNWVDFLRGLTGGYLIWCYSFAPLEIMTEGRDWLMWSLQAAVVVIGVAIQTVRFEQRITLYAPVFFLMGLTFALIGWKAAILTSIGLLALSAALPGLSLLLFCHGALAIILSYLFHKSFSTEVWLFVAVVNFPWVLSVLSRRRLTRINKKFKSVHA